MSKLSNKKSDILSYIEQNYSKAKICKLVNCRASTLENFLSKEHIEYKGNRGGKGYKCSTTYRTALDYIQTGDFINTHKLKEKLIRDSVKEHRCEVCKGTEWMGQPIPIELDHIDGNHYNNRLENLRIICPNCHSQTPTNSGKNNKKT